MTCTCHCIDRLLRIAEQMEEQARDRAARGHTAEQAALNLAAALVRSNLPTRQIGEVAS